MFKVAYEAAQECSNKKAITSRLGLRIRIEMLP
jgi:hypothetical protein